MYSKNKGCITFDTNRETPCMLNVCPLFPCPNSAYLFGPVDSTLDLYTKRDFQFSLTGQLLNSDRNRDLTAF